MSFLLRKIMIMNMNLLIERASTSKRYNCLKNKRKITFENTTYRKVKSSNQYFVCLIIARIMIDKKLFLPSNN